MLEKTFEPQKIEARISQTWDHAQASRMGARVDTGNAQPYAIMIPPPNVTGSLHMGHALNNTLQDILIRFERMRGRDVLWQPGMDHAGIATQMVVERKLAADGEPDRRTLGRDEFLRRVWDWKAESGGTIANQLRRLGASADFSRERFTMDEGLSKAVIEVFVKLHEDGLLYKDKRLVNWDPKFQTAISDLEVVQKEIKGQLYYFDYPLVDGSGHITIATTRPETMLGDVAVAVNPDDERYVGLVGKMVRLPLVGREIPIIADEYSDPEKGTGAVKITPAHDFNDFEVGRRRSLPLINVLDAHGKMAQDVVQAYRGLDRFEARKRIVADMEALGLLNKIEPHTHMVPHGDRSGVVIEPYLTDQWYVNMQPLAEKALAAVRDGRTQFTPKNWEKTYFDWLENIQPWCISRQLWWGHQIPAWYGPHMGDIPEIKRHPHLHNRKNFVARSEAEMLVKAEAYYAGDVRVFSSKEEFEKEVENYVIGRTTIAPLYRDEDVLDTWFSSALWPFSTLGWPEKTPELERYYPTSTLVTGFDIIFFWVARMMMMGLYVMDEVPFATVYIHALVRDESGQKMSKSKGNVIDPLELMSSYGADAVRFTLAALAAQGRDIKLSEQRVAGYRNFVTKLWNATRFCQMNGCVLKGEVASAQSPVNVWVLGELSQARDAITEALEAFRFNDAAAAAYKFVWNTFCDWYLELAKPVFAEGGAKADETRAVAAYVLNETLKLLHPFIPFVTEEIWRVMGEDAGLSRPVLALTAWPKAQAVDSSATSIPVLLELVGAVRSVRSELNIAPNVQFPLTLEQGAFSTAMMEFSSEIMRLARVSELKTSAVAPAGTVEAFVGSSKIWLPVADIIDFSAEKARIDKDMQKLTAEIAKIDTKLGNPDFRARAPEEVIEEQEERKAEAQAQINALHAAFTRLQSLAG